MRQPQLVCICGALQIAHCIDYWADLGLHWGECEATGCEKFQDADEVESDESGDFSPEEQPYPSRA